MLMRRFMPKAGLSYQTLERLPCGTSFTEYKSPLLPFSPFTMNRLVSAATSRFTYTLAGSIIDVPSTMILYVYISGSSFSEVNDHTPLPLFFSSATPGTSAFPIGVSISLCGRNVPVTSTFVACGARIEKVTVPSVFTTGDFT